jgi:hypothetical protein
MTTEEVLLQRFGSPLLTIQQVAEVLNRSPEGLRISLAGDGDVARRLRPGRVKIGRRVYCRVSALAQLIDEA